MTMDDVRAEGRRVLVVEDEYFIAKGLVRDLRAMGFEVVGSAPSIAEALALVASERLDGALLDINLRGEQAFSVADALVARDVPFVFASGYDAEEIPDRFAALPRREKPVRADALIAALFRDTA